MAENSPFGLRRLRISRLWAGLFVSVENRKRVVLGAILLGTSGLLTLAISPELLHKKENFNIGDVARYPVHAQKDFKVVDPAATFQAKERAALEVPPVYFLAEEIPDLIVRNLGLALKACTKASKRNAPLECEEALFEHTGIRPPKEALTFLSKEGASEDLQERLALEVANVYASSFVRGESAGSMAETNPSRPYVVRLRDGKEIEIAPERFIGLSEARQSLYDRLVKTLPNDLPGKEGLAVYISELLLPNVYFDKESTLLRKKVTYEKTPPVLRTVRKGEVIVRQDEVIYPEQLEKLKKNAQASPRFALSYFVGTSLLMFLALLYAIRVAPVVDVAARLKPKNLLYYGFLLVVTLGLLTLSRTGILKVLEVSPKNGFDQFLAIACLPVTLAPMLVRSIFGPKKSFIFLTLYSLLIGWFLPPAAYASLYAFLMGCTLLIWFSRLESRTGFLKLGRHTSFMGMAIVVLVALIEGFPSPGTVSFEKFLLGILAANVGNWLTTILSLGLLPLIEYSFGYATTLSLLELSSMEHPLLKKLAMLAPGTYSHSLTMSVLADRAAKQIGANALLVRVGAYFHDIGKMRRPQYYVENLRPGEPNCHDGLSPALSALIIKAHVKEGIELARAHKLPEAVTRMIPEHHGTTLIKYFFDKAVLLDPNVQEPDFRYPGPKPRSKEAGVLMLADSLEASARTLPEFSVARIQGLVQRTIRTKFLDGQLDDCDMTLKDLHAIARSLIETLISIYHGRVRYELVRQQSAKTEGPRRANTRKPGPLSKPEYPAIQGYDEAALKRLGL